MALLASMLAYLGAAAGLVVALVVSFGVFLSAADRPTSARQAITQQVVTTPSSIVALKTPAKPAVKSPGVKSPIRADQPAAATLADNASSGSPEQTTGVASRHKGARRTKVAARDKYLREQEALGHLKRWAYQQDSDFEVRFMGYADEPQTNRIQVR